MNKLLISLMSLCFANSAMAADFSLEVGFRQQSGSIDSETSSVKSQVGSQLGAVAVFPMTEALGIRTGLLYVSRPIAIEEDATGDQTKIKMNYFEVPVALSYKFEDYASVFAGVSLSMFLDSDVTNGGRIRDEVSPYVPMVVGATFKAHPQFGGTLFFETGGGEVAEGLKSYRAVGASLAIFFE